jgi:serine/threonine protein kinase
MAIEELQNGRYQYLRRLGSGGMGEVYLMQDMRVNRQVAIKVLRTEGPFHAPDATGTSSAQLFEREARAIAALDHPNILPLYDFGEEVRDGESMTYMVMPYCADGSLEQWLHQRGEELLTAPQVAALIEQAAEGLQYAHEHKVIHLDVKPPNFLIRRNRKDPLRPMLLLADFGIARNFTTISSASRTIRGTPAAMAPEQWSGEPVFASDQYALAVMTYEMLVGRPPFTGSLEQLMYRHFSVQPQPPSSFNPRLPQAVDEVLLRALSKKPQDRYPTIADFASELVEAANQPAAYAESELKGYSTLTISPSEAEAGLSRMLTLTGGEEVTVRVPAGAQHGQILRLPRSVAPGKPDVLLVNIEIQQPEATLTPVQIASTPSALQPPEQVQSLAETPQPVEEKVAADVQAPEQAPLKVSPAPPGVVSAQVVEQPQLRLAPATPATPVEHDGPTIASTAQKPEQITTAPRSLLSERRRVGVLAVVSILLALIILVAGGVLLLNHPSTASVQPTPTHQAHATPTVTPSPTPVPPGAYIAGSYNGSMANNDGSQGMGLSIHFVQKQGSGALSGTITLNSAVTYNLSGTVDMAGNFSFLVKPAGQTPYVFHGKYGSDTILHGFFCRSDTGSCQQDAGYFTVGPRF